MSPPGCPLSRRGHRRRNPAQAGPHRGHVRARSAVPVIGPCPLSRIRRPRGAVSAATRRLGPGGVAPSTSSATANSSPSSSSSVSPQDARPLRRDRPGLPAGAGHLAPMRTRHHSCSRRGPGSRATFGRCCRWGALRHTGTNPAEACKRDSSPDGPHPPRPAPGCSGGQAACRRRSGTTHGSRRPRDPGKQRAGPRRRGPRHRARASRPHEPGRNRTVFSCPGLGPPSQACRCPG